MNIIYTYTYMYLYKLFQVGALIINRFFFYVLYYLLITYLLILTRSDNDMAKTILKLRNTKHLM